MALSNIALDLIGQARELYTYAAKAEGNDNDEDKLAYLRDVRQYRNLLLVEQPNGDFAQTLVRQFFYSAFADLYWRAMMTSRDTTLAAIAAKSEKESAYHLRHASEWIIRLGDGTDESHKRAQAAIDHLWAFTGEMFAVDDGERALIHGRRPVVTVDGGEPGKGASAAGARTGKPRLSPWAAKLKQTDWPMSYQAPLKPLRPGHGDSREFPNEVWARCLRRSAVRAARRELGPINRPRLRESLAHYLATSRGVRATVDQILILPSAQAALTLIAAALISPSDEVWVEDPGYPGAAAAFRASGARVTGVRLDEQGMIISSPSPRSCGERVG